MLDDPDATLDLLASTRTSCCCARSARSTASCGLRVGFGAVRGDDFVGAVNQVRQPFFCNAAAQAAAVEALKHSDAVAERVERAVVARLAASRTGLRRAGHPGRRVAGELLLVRPPGATPTSPRSSRRWRERGVLVRAGAALGRPGALRVTYGTAIAERSASSTRCANCCRRRQSHARVLSDSRHADASRCRLRVLSPGDLARRSVGTLRSSRSLAPSAASIRRSPSRRIEREKVRTHDDRDEADGDRGRDPGRHRADRVRVGATRAPSRGEEVTVIGAHRRPRARRAPRPRGRARRRQASCRSSSPTSSPPPSCATASARRARDRRAQGRRRALRADRRPVHGRVARPDARHRRRRQGRRRDDVPRRRLQAAHLARTPSRASVKRACACSRRPRSEPACRSSPS